MENQKIKEALATLTEALGVSQPEDTVALTLNLTTKQVAILLDISRTNVSVPRVTVACYSRNNEADVKEVLNVICDKIERMK